MLSLLTFKSWLGNIKGGLADKKPEITPKETQAEETKPLRYDRLPNEPKRYFTFDSQKYAPKEIWAKQSDSVPSLFFVKAANGQSWDTAYTGPYLFQTSIEAIRNEEIKVLGAIEDYRRRIEKLGLLRRECQEVQ